MNFMYVGIDDRVLVNLKAAGKLPVELAINIDQLLLQLEQIKTIGNVDIAEKSRNAVLRQLIRLGMSHRPIGFAEYQWYAAFSVALFLLKQFPITILTAQVGLFWHVFETPVDQSDVYNVQKIHAVAKEIYKVSSNASDVVLVVTKIFSINHFTLLVGMSLLWAAFYEIVGQKTNFFQIFGLHELAQMIENNLKGNDLTRDGELQNIHDFLSLYSAYQTIVLIHDIKKDELKCYAECFTVDHEDLLVIHEFLLLTKTRLEALIAKKERLKECNSMFKVLQNDILSSLEPFLTVIPMEY